MEALSATLMVGNFSIEYYWSLTNCLVSEIIEINSIANESNGVQIGDEFVPRKWYFLALEHDKPYLART